MLLITLYYDMAICLYFLFILTCMCVCVGLHETYCMQTMGSISITQYLTLRPDCKHVSPSDDYIDQPMPVTSFTIHNSFHIKATRDS